MTKGSFGYGRGQASARTAVEFASLLSGDTPRAYAGIGSRETPRLVCDLMTAIAAALAARGWILRSGGAEKADQAFEAGVGGRDDLKQIFLPWRGFEGSKSPYFAPYVTDAKLAETIAARRECWEPKLLTGRETDAEIVAHAHLIAEHYHPAWDRCSSGAQKLHSRNGHQVLGLKLDTPSDAIIGWTIDGNATGGTGQAIRIAEGFGIPVYNLKRPADLAMVIAALGLTGFDQAALLAAPPEKKVVPARRR